MKYFVYLILIINSFCFAVDYQTQYLEKNSNKEKEIIVNFITNQFANKPKVSQKELDHVWNNLPARELLHMARFQIIDNKLYAGASSIHRHYFLNLFHYFSGLVKKYKIKDVDFIIYARDEIPENNLDPEIFKTPAFMMFKNYDSEQERNCLIMPDSTFLKQDWNILFDKIKSARNKIAWQNKLPLLFWRGSATAGVYNLENISQIARLKFIFLSKLHPQIIDAALVNPIYEDSKSGKKLKQIIEILFGSNSNKVSEVDHLKYKYLVSLDGNSATGTRVPWIMLSDSVLVKQESNKIEWFYPALEAYKHYIPIKSNLTNIFKQYDWLANNESEVARIITNAQNFVENNLTAYDIDMQMLIILDKYHQIQKDKQIIATLTPEDEVISISSVLLVMLAKIKKYFFF
jgi:hypothetical protein